ncbi:hypothetical protein [Pseudobutyrivibrio sp.]|uniref:hypothetical protein n=1 Tax=Pseudobutyrivibrio sp. TaxID=2014367 RepID=UPI0038653180
MGNNDYGMQLEELRRKRDEVEDIYRSRKRHIEELDYSISKHKRTLEETVTDNQTVATDSRLQNIYNEREQILSSMRTQQYEFDEYIDEQYKKETMLLDEQEAELKERQAEEGEEEDSEESTFGY